MERYPEYIFNQSQPALNRAIERLEPALADEVGKLKATAGVTGTPMDKVLAMFGFLTGETDDPTGKETSTVLRNLLSKVNSRDITLGGKRIQFGEGMDAADKLSDVMARIQSGEFGDPGVALAQMTGELGRESASMISALGVIGQQPERLAETQAMVAQAGKEGFSYQAQQRQIKEAVVSGAPGMAATKAAAGAAEISQTGDVIGGEWERVRQRMKSFETQYGITTGFDFAKSGRELAGIYGEQNPLEWERGERQRLLARKLTGMTPGSAGMGAEAAAGFTAPGESFYAGMTEEEMLRAAITRGAVSPRGGIGSAEAQALQQVGISQETIQEWNRLFLDGLTEKLAEAFAKAMQQANTQPGPNALNPGG
jgi:hypothetical protein